MVKRKKYGWKVQLTDVEGGNNQTVEVRNYWSPDHEGMPEMIAEAAAAEVSAATRSRWIPVGIAAIAA